MTLSQLFIEAIQEASRDFHRITTPKEIFIMEDYGNVIHRLFQLVNMVGRMLVKEMIVPRKLMKKDKSLIKLMR